MKNINQRDAVQAIAYGLPFQASALSGFVGTSPVLTTGRLDPEEVSAYYIAEREGITYAVYSYGTPIAWRTLSGWYFVGQKFSRTTSAHQNIVRRGASEMISA